MADDTSEPATADDATATVVDTDNATVEVLGEAGQKALAEERRARRSATQTLARVQRELEELRSAGQTEQEKAVAAARTEGEQAGRERAAGMLRRAAIVSAAAGKLADPEDAVRLLDLDDVPVDEDGVPDSKAIAAAIVALIKQKPYLAAAGSRPAPLPGGGATPSSGSDVEAQFADLLRGRL